MTQLGSGWENSSHAFRAHQRNMDPTNCFMHWIRKPINELQEMCNLWFPQTGLWALPMLCTPHPHPIAGFLYMHAINSGESEALQTVGEHVQKACLTTELGESTETWAFSTVQEKINRRLTTYSLALQNQRKHTMFRYPTIQEETKSVEHRYI